MVDKLKEDKLDFTGITASTVPTLTTISNTDIAVGPVYEGKHVISLCKATDWTTGCTVDLTFDLWLCKITPPAVLAADIVVDTSAAVTSMVIAVNSFSVTDPACGTLVYEVPATTGVADISA